MGHKTVMQLVKAGFLFIDTSKWQAIGNMLKGYFLFEVMTSPAVIGSQRPVSSWAELE